MTVRIKADDFKAIVEFARKGLPNEICGLIAGTVADGVKTVEKVYFLNNIDLSPEHFSMDPREQLTAVKDMRSLGFALLGNFHCHPETPARPSQEDIVLAHDPSASYLILSLVENKPVLKSFHIENGAVTQEKLEIQSP